MATNETRQKHDDDAPDMFTAIRMVRRRRNKLNKAKRAADEVTYLNIVAMMDMMTIILVFLLKSVSFSTVQVSVSDALSLPYSTTQLPPMEAVKIFVSKTDIVVEDRKVADLAAGVVNPDFVDSKNRYLIPNMKKVLDEEAVRQSNLQKLRPGIKFQGNVTVFAHKDTPYHTILQVLYTAGQVNIGEGDNAIGFSKFRLTVMRAGA
jgi:biopolymer transport protein ExbD